MKKENPYLRLKRVALEWVVTVNFPHIKTMWNYPIKDLKTGWQLQDLYERTAAAKTLGYDVVLEANDDGLRVIYRKKPASMPWELQ